MPQRRGGYRGQWKGIPHQGAHNNHGYGKDFPEASTGGAMVSNSLLNSCSILTAHSDPSDHSWAGDAKILGQGIVEQTRWTPRAQHFPTAECSTLDSQAIQSEHNPTGPFKQTLNEVKGVFAQAQFRATFYPKFENEKSDQEIRARMIDVVHSGKGVLEVSLKHSGSLFMYAGDHGGAFAKNSFGNLYSAVGVFVLGRTLQEAWGAGATEKQREFNTYLETHHLCISMELVTAVLGDHGQRPLKDYVVVTAVTDLKRKPRFYSTPDLIAFCRQWRLPTNHIWLFSTGKSAASFFTAYDALCEEGTATRVSKILDQIADISVAAVKSHSEYQGEILEGLVARIVSAHSAEYLQQVLKDFPLVLLKDQGQLRPSLRDLCSANKASEQQQIKALLQHVGLAMCSDCSDWDSNRTDGSLFNKFLGAASADEMTAKLQEMIRVLQGRNMQVRFPCRLKWNDKKGGKIHFKLTIHVLNDIVFHRYQREMRNNPTLWPLYRGFFVDVCLCRDQRQIASQPSIPAVDLLSEKLNTLHVSNVGDDMLADNSENLMLKLKFLPYKIRTFLIRNGLDTLFNNGFGPYRKYYFRQMEIWGTSYDKQRQLDFLLTEWAEYVTKKYHGRKLHERIYLSEAEPFLNQFGEQSLLNRQLVGPPGPVIRTEDFVAELPTERPKAGEKLHESKAPMVAKQLSHAIEDKGMLVFFPGIPGCAKSSLCKELLKNPSGLGDGKVVHSLMGDLIKGRYWSQLAQERKKDPLRITLADKNAPNEEVWKTIEEICQSTNAIGVPVVPDSEGTISNPFSLEALAVFIYRVLQRVNHPGNLDRNSPNAGYVLLMFYNLYKGKDRREFEESLRQRFGYLVKQPLLKSNRAAMPSPCIRLLTQGLGLFKHHTEKHGRLDSTKGSFREEWSSWERQLRETLFGIAEHLNAIQVPVEEGVQSVRKQLQAIVLGETSLNVPVAERRFNNVTYAALSLPPKEIVNLLHKLSLSNQHVQEFLSGKRIESNLKSAHLTLAHKRSHGVPAVAAYGALCGSSVPVQLSALLFSDRLCALEAHICANNQGVSSKNDWPHVTVWTAEGIPPKEANSLPQLVPQGQACRIDLSRPFVIPGIVSLL